MPLRKSITDNPATEFALKFHQILIVLLFVEKKFSSDKKKTFCLDQLTPNVRFIVTGVLIT